MNDVLSIEPSWSEMQDLLGGVDASSEIKLDLNEQAVIEGITHLRADLVQAMVDDGVRVNALAKRLRVSPSATSKMVSSDGDMKLSTAILWARALDRMITFSVTRQPRAFTISISPVLSNEASSTRLTSDEARHTRNVPQVDCAFDIPRAVFKNEVTTMMIVNE